MENFGRLNDTEKFKSWFFKIITNCYFDTFRKSIWKKFQPVEKIEPGSKIPEVFDISQINEDRILLTLALSRITDKERAAILLYEIAGFSIEEIAQIQNEKSISAVKSRLSRTRQKLRDIIESVENPVNNKRYKVNNENVKDVETETLKIISEINPQKNGR